MLSDEDILNYWHNPDFSASFRGVRTFQVVLKTDLGIDVPLKRLYDVLKTDQVYLIHHRSVRHFPRRQYYVHAYGELTQMDIAVLFPDKNGFRYFLLLVDVFSTKVFTVPLKSRQVGDIISALKTIIQNFNSAIHEIQADREGAFISKEVKKFFVQQKIIFRPRFGKNKASYAENYIQIIKVY